MIGSNIRIISAAEEELIANNGHIEMLAVAQRAGVSTGLAYHHFGSKAGVIAAVVSRFYEPIKEISFGHNEAQSFDWISREKKRAKELINYYYDHPLSPLIFGRLGREPEVLDVENAHTEELIRIGASNIAQGQREGFIRVDLNPLVTVALLMGGSRQVINTALTSPQRPSRVELLADIWLLTEGALGLNNEHETNNLEINNAK